MPVPKPQPGEPKTDFIARCMSDAKMVSEFPENGQRAAVCNQAFQGEEIKNRLYKAWQG